MPTKRELADRAYEKQEDERALKIVADVAFQYARELDEDELYDRIMEIFAAVERVRARMLPAYVPPTPEPGVTGVKGQINLLDGTVETCPKSGAPFHQWAPLQLQGDTVDEEAKLQCGNCSQIVVVSFAQYNRVVEGRRRDYQHMDTVKSPVIPEKATPTRGAR